MQKNRLNQLITGCLTILICLFLSSDEVFAADKVAILPLESQSESLGGDVLEKATSYLRSGLAATDRFIIVGAGRQNEKLESFIDRKKKESYEECYDEKCQIELGKALAADMILRTKIEEFGSCVLSVHLIDLAKEALVDGSTETFSCRIEGLKVAIDKITNELRDKSPTEVNKAKSESSVGSTGIAAGAEAPKSVRVNESATTRPPFERPSDSWTISVGGKGLQSSRNMYRTDADAVYHLSYPIALSVLVDGASLNPFEMTQLGSRLGLGYDGAYLGIGLSAGTAIGSAAVGANLRVGRYESFNWQTEMFGLGDFFHVGTSFQIPLIDASYLLAGFAAESLKDRSGDVYRDEPEFDSYEWRLGLKYTFGRQTAHPLGIGLITGIGEGTFSENPPDRTRTGRVSESETAMSFGVRLEYRL